MAVAASLVRAGARRLALPAGVGVLLALAACTSPRSPARAPGRDQPVADAAAAATDASYDWHGLVLVPFGSLLKASPVPLHEVLQFHDETSRAEAADKDCFATAGAPPRFLGRQPAQYLLCFDHDRLNRIEAAVELPAAAAPRVFAAACALWLKTTPSAVGSGDACEGRDGRVAFSARLGLLSDDPATVSMTLTDSPPSETVHDASSEP